MSIQRSVQQQNASVEAGIRAIAELFIRSPAEFGWLHAILRSNSVDSVHGMLAHLTDTPDQGGRQMAGVWLTNAKRFFQFQALLSYESGELVEVEHFTDITPTVVVSKGQRGTGESFGFIALRVLESRA